MARYKIPAVSKIGAGGTRANWSEEMTCLRCHLTRNFPQYYGSMDPNCECQDDTKWRGYGSQRVFSCEVSMFVAAGAVTSTPKPRKRPARVIIPAIEQVKPLELVGTHEIAARLEVGPSAVSNWIARGKLVPLASLHCGPVFDWEVVESFAEKRSQKGA